MAYRRKQQGPVASDDRRTPQPQSLAASSYNYTSMDSMREPKVGLWGALARKAKGILDEDAAAHKFDDHGKVQSATRKPNLSDGAQAPQSRWPFDSYGGTERSEPRKRSEALAASVNQFGGRIRNALEEGLIIVDNKTSNIIEETKKIQIRRKPDSSSLHMQNPAADAFPPPSFTLNKAEAAQETQLKASRDVANAMAAKAKLVLRELKTVKADLAFAKQRCTQLEEENKMLRETKQKGVKIEEDDDLIRMQLETLLAEKSRLAQENSMYARENRFLREIVDFHQFAAHNVVSFADGNMKDSKLEEDTNRAYTENMFPVVEAYLAQEEVSPVPSRPDSPILSQGESSSPVSIISVDNAANSPRNALKPNELVPDKD
ncbi:hypothetical protein CFC21_018849 [Triticum aestivum]|uniref:Uncharacterized protein n=3 Tax=Triticinae TaxID=1648030 RepID=A0A453HPV1_AEGTS|nr:uncharacterized protein LOC109757836 [Aegilops tauschii subsp. strangulata]XP_044374182.1 uncharacterized protein LOC123096506 [Triticum aestivum]KAF7003550.1 hypothetical protein CFC21_018849 [Triticum aestivum]